MRFSTAVLGALLMVAQGEPQPQSRIEGLVVNAGNGETLSSVSLFLRQENALQRDRQYTATSTSEGRFVLKDLPKGRYILSASKSGFVDQKYGQKQANRPGAVLDLTTSQTVRDIVIRMTAGGIISGRVYDQNAEPVERTVVVAFRKNYQRDGKSVLSQVAASGTNDLGEYRIYWLAPGTYYLFALVVPRNRPSGNPSDWPTFIDQSEEPPDAFDAVFYPRGEDESQATPIKIEAGTELRGIDFSLQKSKAVRVKGRVVNAAGQPVADAILMLRLKHVEALTANFWFNEHTDHDGNFEFHNQAPGKYVVAARWTEPGFRSLYTEQSLQVGNRDVTDLQIVLQNNPNVEGRMIMESGEPLPQDRTVLMFTEPGGASFGTGVESDGRFSLSNVAPRLLHLELTGFPDDYFIRSARTGNTDVLRDGINLAEASQDSLIVVVSSQGAKMEGVVADERQSPVVGASVVLMPNAARDRSNLFKAATTDQYGHFAFRGIVPGDYKIFAWDDLEPNIYFDPAFVEPYESQGKAIHLDQQGSLTLSLKPIPAAERR
jgi:protocatechuate 3,4-dioxygenase beta subunit